MTQSPTNPAAGDDRVAHALERAEHVLGIVANYSDAVANGGEFAPQHLRDLEAMNGDVIAEDVRTIRAHRAAQPQSGDVGAMREALRRISNGGGDQGRLADNALALPNPDAPPQADSTDAARRAALEERVAIWSGEHHAYWRKGADGSGSGYTGEVTRAGVWSRRDAIRLTGGCGPEKLIALHVRPGALAAGDAA